MTPARPSNGDPHRGLLGGFGILCAALAGAAAGLPSCSTSTGEVAVLPGPTAGAGAGGEVTAGALGSSGAGGQAANGAGGTSQDGAAPILLAGGPGTAGSSGGGPAHVCAAEKATAELEPVYLGFAFDVSGSMGKHDFPWHDPALKWDPVVLATRIFFEDPASAGLLASLTAFPIDDEDGRCDPESYRVPDVEMTELPSARFGETLDEIRQGDWRGGTPTLAVVTGGLDFLTQSAESAPGRYALVLVTDGYPQGCDDNDIASVEAVVRAAASTIPTYVIGVKNPPLTDSKGKPAPDTVSDLTRIADAGGTGSAYIIDTGDPAATSAAFRDAVERIRGGAIACALNIPQPPSGRAFERDKVLVSATSGATTTALSYDESCASPNSWHYDDIGAPSQVVLCDATCAAVQADPNAVLEVEFTCEPVIEVPR